MLHVKLANDECNHLSVSYCFREYPKKFSPVKLKKPYGINAKDFKKGHIENNKYDRGAHMVVCKIPHAKYIYLWIKALSLLYHDHYD